MAKRKSNPKPKTTRKPDPEVAAKAEQYQWVRDIIKDEREKQNKKLASYQGAVATRLSGSWATSQKSILYDTTRYADIARMRERARALEENNVIADGLLSRAVENVVAQGFELQATTADAEWNQQAEDLWNGWVDSADTSGLVWLEHQRLAFRAYLRDGDFGCILLKDGRLQPVESQMIETPYRKVEGRVIDGVKVNELGRPVGFHVATYDESGRGDWALVDASDFVFLCRRKRPLQVRGETCFAQSFTLFEQIEKWTEAQIIAARIAACFGIAIIKNSATQFQQNLAVEDNNAGVAQRQLDLSPGMAPILEPGEDIKTISPSHPQQSFPDNLVAMLRLCGLSIGMPLELVLMDYSRTNFSSARASMLQAYRSFKSLQEIFTQNYLSRIYRWRISKWIKEGKLPANPDAWNHRFVAPCWPYLDPVGEIQSAQMAIDGGFDSLTSVLLSQGKDFATIKAQRERELAELKAAGIPIIHHSASVPFADPSQQQGESGETGATVNAALTSVKEDMDAYGVGVRAGAITPQTDDENHFRQKLNLPSMSPSAVDAWQKDKGVRRPITLAGNETASTPPAQEQEGEE